MNNAMLQSKDVMDVLPDMPMLYLMRIMQKSHLVGMPELLQEYFAEKRVKFLENVWIDTQQEAKSLQKVFPQFTLSYILKKLDSFIDLPNRKEIVVRHLIYKSIKNKKHLKRNLEFISSTTIKNEGESLSDSPSKIRKIDSERKEPFSNFVNQTTFSGNFHFFNKATENRHNTSSVFPENLPISSTDNNNLFSTKSAIPLTASANFSVSAENTNSVPYFARQSSGKNCPETITKPQSNSESDSFNFLSPSSEFAFTKPKPFFSLDLVKEVNNDITGKFFIDKSMGKHVKIGLTTENNDGIDKNQKSPNTLADDLFTCKVPAESTKESTKGTPADLDLSSIECQENCDKDKSEIWPQNSDEIFGLIDSILSKGEYFKKNINVNQSPQQPSLDDFYRNSKPSTSKDTSGFLSDNFNNNSKPSTSINETLAEQKYFFDHLNGPATSEQSQPSTCLKNKTLPEQNNNASLNGPFTSEPKNPWEMDFFDSLEKRPNAWNSTFKQETVVADDKRMEHFPEKKLFKPNMTSCIRVKKINDLAPKKEIVPELINELVSAKIRSEKKEAEKKAIDQLREMAEAVIKEKQKEKPSADKRFVNRLCEMFPDACRTYLENLCLGKLFNDTNLDIVLNTILEAGNAYPKRVLPPKSPETNTNPEEQLNILKEFLPDADPDYLEMMCQRLAHKQDEMKQFLDNAIEFRDYPTLKDYQKRQQVSAQQKQYTTDFNIENFLQLIPNPVDTFSKKDRQIGMDISSIHYALVFLKNKFDKLPVRLIQDIFKKTNYRLYNSYTKLKVLVNKNDITLKTRRKPMSLPHNFQNIPVLQEIAYITHETEILKYMEEAVDKKRKEREDIKNAGLMKTCNCCYDDEIMPSDLFTCEKGCEFCRQCIQKSTEVKFAEGNLNFICLANCTAAISLQQLQNALTPKFFSKVAQKKALAEVKAAGIEELEMCPFCDFATIPVENDKIFHCLNEECMKESCRLCKEPNHIPLKCEEVEKDADVKARVFVENQMTEALLRKCYKCGVKYFKEEGCNKMTCSCGAAMCYVCGKPVKDYKHFNGLGGDQINLCPLYSDTNVLNKENVLKGAEMAKAAVGVDLKNDPSVDLDKHFKERAKKIRTEPYFDVLNRLNNQHRQVLEQQRLLTMERLREQMQPFNNQNNN